MKCIVKLCPNDVKDGRFEGPVCVPCVGALRGLYIEDSPFRRAASRYILASLLMTGVEVGRD